MNTLTKTLLALFLLSMSINVDMQAMNAGQPEQDSFNPQTSSYELWLNAFRHAIGNFSPLEEIQEDSSRQRQLEKEQLENLEQRIQVLQIQTLPKNPLLIVSITQTYLKQLNEQCLNQLQEIITILEQLPSKEKVNQQFIRTIIQQLENALPQPGITPQLLTQIELQLRNQQQKNSSCIIL